MILTAIGATKIADALALLEKVVEWKYIAVGNGSGSEPTFVPTDTELINEVWRGEVLNNYRDTVNLAWVNFEGIVPEDVGNFYIREIAIFDVDGDMVAVGAFPTTYKPVFDGDVSKSVHIKIGVQIENSENVTFLIDPTTVMASQAWATSNFTKKEEIHKFDTSINGVDIDFILPRNKEDNYTVTVFYQDISAEAVLRISCDESETIAGVDAGDSAEIDVLSVTQFIFCANTKIWFLRRG